MRFILLISNFLNIIFLFGTIGSLEIGVIGISNAILKIVLSFIFVFISYLLHKGHQQKIFDKKYERVKNNSNFMF